MSHERQIQESFASGPAPFSDDGGAPTAVAEGRVEVYHGVYAHSLPLGGLTVEQARAELQDRMNIDPEAIAVVDGNRVPEDTILQEGNVLHFVKEAGEKG
jgi:hypothetical protein